MTKIRLDRRTFLIGLGASVAASAFGINILQAQAQESTIPETLYKWLTEKLTEKPIPQMPTKTGTLEPEQIQRLSDFADFLSETWSMTAYLEQSQFDITRLINPKTEEKLSYLTEYTLAVQVLDRAIQEMSESKKALDLLAFGKFSPDELINTRIGRFRRVVFEEFTYYIVISGGFRRFGPKGDIEPPRNYGGYIGGPFTNDSYLPYRGIKQ